MRRGLPRPEVEVRHMDVGPHGGVRLEARLAFQVAVRGPILLGRDAHRGGGLFAAHSLSPGRSAAVSNPI